MQKFELDFSYLCDRVVENKTNKIPVKGNEDRMQKVAFDLFRLDGDSKEDLWMVQADDDGNEFLVRTYDLPEDSKIANSNWSVLLDKKGSNITISYKDSPITRLAMLEFGIDNKEDARIFGNIVLKKLSSDMDFVEKLLSDLPEEKLQFITGPESTCCHKEDSQIMPSQHEGLVLILDKPEGGCSEENPESCSPPDGEAQDADEWWDNLSDKERDELFEKFSGVATKKQAMLLTKLEAKLSKSK